MTSFIIQAHEARSIPSVWKDDANCPFCLIIRGESPAVRVYENDKVIAILDIAPLREGHTLVIPKTHYSRVSELPAEFAAACGEAVSKVANALTQALGNTALNVVCNQEYAQAVFHVHYHIIPAPRFDNPVPTAEKVDHVVLPLTHKEMHRRETEARSELDFDDSQELITRIRSHL